MKTAAAVGVRVVAALLLGAALVAVIAQPRPQAAAQKAAQQPSLSSPRPATPRCPASA
jgi:uncharacterized protein involved in copper resistance